MTPALPLALAALAAIGLAAWGYGLREERVSGRLAPATVRALALFLLLGGLWLPALRGGPPGPPARVALLDVSRSMSLPAAAHDSGPTRLDAALRLVDSLRPERLYLFGSEPRPVALDSLPSLRPDAARSRLAPALEAVRLAGVDSVVVITDGEWEDRPEALRTATRLGLGLREARIAAAPRRVAIAELSAPERLAAGDTARLAVDVVAGGGEEGDGTGEADAPQGVGVDSVTVELRRDGERIASARVAVPTTGRRARAELEFVPEAPTAETEWRRYEVALSAGADPYGAADAAGRWIEISDAASGAVLVSTLPDWETRFLAPGLGRLVLGAVRGFLRLGEDRYLETGARPRVVQGAERIRRAIRGARLLVVQADPGSVPPWLASALEAHPRTLVFGVGPGPLPGTDLALRGPLPGEWYPTPPIPPSPAAALLVEAELEALPPMRELYAVEGEVRWSVLEGQRGRQGERRPLLVADEAGGRRTAVATGAGWWRWAFREGAPRRVYEGALSGLVGWLLEDATPRLVTVVPPDRPGGRIEWRVRSTVRDLRIDVVDAAGDSVWSGAWERPPERIAGPPLSAGLHRVRVAARGPGGTVEEERPLEVEPERGELLPRPVPPPTLVPAAPLPREADAGRRPRPVWPFAVAALLLCGEWIWRRRLGLR